MNKINSKRRNLLRLICVGSAAACLPLSAQAGVFLEKKVREIQWEIPKIEEVTKFIVDNGGDGYWSSRAITMARAVWSSLELTARNQDGIVTRKMLNDMLYLKNLEKFGLDHADTKEGRIVNKYIENIPAYSRGKELSETTLENHGYLTMQVYRIAENPTLLAV